MIAFVGTAEEVGRNAFHLPPLHVECAGALLEESTELVTTAAFEFVRPAAQRAAEGEVHPVVHPLYIERNVLEWRFDPRSEARLEQASYNARVIVLCQEGYTSSLAADALVRLGVRRATDLIGGFRAWREAGLPVAPR